MITTERSRIVGLQAVLVAILLLVVYLTLLRPDEQGPLVGVKGPGGPPTTQAPPGDDQGGNGGPGRGEGGNEGGGEGDGGGVGGGGASGGGGGGLLVSAAPVVTGPGGPEGQPGGANETGETPSDNQYGDALALLEARVGRALTKP